MGGGYVSCGCRDCFEIAIADKDGERALCHACKEAGCEICDCDDPTRVRVTSTSAHRVNLEGCPHGECSAPGAYGEPDEDDES